jgi:hypothetical protein
MVISVDQKDENHEIIVSKYQKEAMEPVAKFDVGTKPSVRDSELQTAVNDLWQTGREFKIPHNDVSIFDLLLMERSRHRAHIIQFPMNRIPVHKHYHN